MAFGHFRTKIHYNQNAADKGVRRLVSHLPTVEKIVELLDAQPACRAEANAIVLESEFALDDLVPGYIKAFPRLRRYPGRMCILYRLGGYAREEKEVVDLALDALFDRSRIVRHHACAALAYSQLERAVPKLRLLLEHSDAKTRSHAEAAIDAIVSQNHHYFADREHTGQIFWHFRGDA